MTAGAYEPSAKPAEPPHPFAEFWQSFARNRGAVIGLLVICALILIAVFAELLAPYSPYATNQAAFLKPPFWQSGGLLAHRAVQFSQPYFEIGDQVLDAGHLIGDFRRLGDRC